MTRLERTIRQVSDLRDFYLKLKKQRRRGARTDLDHLAGTWSAAEAMAFARSTGKVDVRAKRWRARTKTGV
jgi:membrane-bound ClpP family serine protease